jgi:hypothetical protein
MSQKKSGDERVERRKKLNPEIVEGSMQDASVIKIRITEGCTDEDLVVTEAIESTGVVGRDFLGEGGGVRTKGGSCPSDTFEFVILALGCDRSFSLKNIVRVMDRSGCL